MDVYVKDISDLMVVSNSLDHATQLAIFKQKEQQHVTTYF